ncbi:MAG: hypothetical protein WBK55_03735 [Alphaproteobacteria bacterium]
MMLLLPETIAEPSKTVTREFTRAVELGHVFKMEELLRDKKYLEGWLFVQKKEKGTMLLTQTARVAYMGDSQGYYGDFATMRDWLIKTTGNQTMRIASFQDWHDLFINKLMKKAEIKEGLYRVGACCEYDSTNYHALDGRPTKGSIFDQSRLRLFCEVPEFEIA